jgi:hypothetical protein
VTESKSGAAKFSYVDFLVERSDGRVSELESEFCEYIAGMVMPRLMQVSVDDLAPLLHSLGHPVEISRRDAHCIGLDDESRSGGGSRLRVSLDLTVSVSFVGGEAEAEQRSLESQDENE